VRGETREQAEEAGEDRLHLWVQRREKAREMSRWVAEG
jgi:hypothetical protein